MARISTKKKLTYILIKAAVKGLWFINPNGTQLYKSSTGCLFSCMNVRLQNSLLGQNPRSNSLLKHNYVIIHWLLIISSSVFLTLLLFRINLRSSLTSLLVSYSPLGKWHITERGTPLQCLTTLPLSLSGAKNFFHFQDWLQVKRFDSVQKE